MMRAGAASIVFAALAAAAVSPVQATIVLTPGNNPQPGETNVIFFDQGPTSPILGSLGGGTDNISVTGTTVLAGDQLTSLNGVIKGSGSDLMSATVTPSGGSLGLLIFDVANVTGSLSISGTDGGGNVFSFGSLPAGIGQNFYTLEAISGETIDSVSVSSTGSFESLSSIRGIFHASSGAVPEPSTWAMILLGFGAIGFAARRGRRIGLTFRKSVALERRSATPEP